MDKDGIEKLGLIVSSLKEFCYGLDTLDEISLEAKQGSAQMRFYLNSLYEYSARYYLIDKKSDTPIGGNLFRALRELNLENNLEPIIETLNERIGNLDLQTILRTFRNKMITHSKFSFEPLESRIYDVEDLREPENYNKFQGLLQRLYDQTKKLYIKLALVLEQYGQNYQFD